MPTMLRSSPGPRVAAAREAVLEAARGAFGPGPMWRRTQAWLNAAHELVEAEAAAEAPTKPNAVVPGILPPRPPPAER